MMLDKDIQTLYNTNNLRLIKELIELRKKGDADER